MKFLMILNDMAWFWSHRLPLARGIMAGGWELSVATAQAAGDQKMHAMGVRGIDLPDPVNILSHIKIPLAIYRVIKHEQPDIVHAITIRHAFYTGIVTRLMNYKPVVFTIAGLGSLFTSQTLKARLLRPIVITLFCFAFARDGIHIIFQNEDDRAGMLDAGVIDIERTTVIRGSGVDITEFPFTTDPNDPAPVVLFVSRLLKEKGIYEFVEAARMLKKQGSPARFVVAGDFYPKNPHSLDPAVMDRWVKEGVIEWLGLAKDMPEQLKRATLVTLPSYYGEGVPKALLEAAAVGRAIVTTDMPGCREAVKDQYNGLLVPARDARALAEAIGKLLGNPMLRQTMGRNGRHYIEQDFTVESVVSRTLAVYNRLLNTQEDKHDRRQTARAAGTK